MVATPIETLPRSATRKGLYAKARAGILKESPGISDPYEEPTNAEVVINTRNLSRKRLRKRFILHLEREGFIGVNGELA